MTGDEIKFVFGAAAESALNNSDPNRLGISEPMDHSWKIEILKKNNEWRNNFVKLSF